MTLSRRNFMQQLAVGSGGILLPRYAVGQNSQASLNELKIPPQLSGETIAGKKHYSLKAQRGTSRFLPDLDTPTIGINGDFLGPTLRFSRGDNVAMHVANALGEQTTVHWHGLHVPAKADGGPALIIEDGANWNPEFQIIQRAGTFWYHSHLMARTGEQVYRGLSGMIIIDDDQSSQSSLPSTYAIDDIPLIVQDRRFNEDGSLSYVSMHRDVMTGLFGDTILVNGTTSPVFTPTTSKVRFRLLNSSNARTYTFAFDDSRRFQLVASDGGLIEGPLDMGELVLAPSERAEIIVDFSDGKPVNLISLPMPDDSPFATQGMMRRMHPGNDIGFQILALQPQPQLQTSDSISNSLSSIARIAESEAVKTRQLTLSMVMGMGGNMGSGMGGMGRGSMGGSGGNFFINGEAMDMAVINQQVKMGDTEIWSVTNDSMMMHPFHIHHSQFQILDRNGQPPAAHEMGYKDSVKIGPGETVRFIMRFENFSDPDIAYMYHCHILEHEDNGMMGQFLVV